MGRHPDDTNADYRLCVFSVNLPPLRERREDILPLAAHFLEKHSRRSGPALQLSTAAAEALLAFDWPANVRELQSAIVRAAQDHGGDVAKATGGDPPRSARRR